jgi:hypothetical protein
MLASAKPVTRLVAPGPSVARQTPALPVRRPELDRAADHRIHDVQIFFTGNSEDIFDAFVFEAFNKQIASFHRGSSGVIDFDNVNYDERNDADEKSEHQYRRGDRQKARHECIDDIAQERQFHVKSPVLFLYLSICILIN